MFSALFFLLLVLLGALLFSIACGFSLYPAVQKALFELLSCGSTIKEDFSEKGKSPRATAVKARLRGLRRLFVSKKVRIRRGRKELSGWLFLPVAQRTSPERILIFAPEGRALSLKDLSFFLEKGFLARAGCSSSPPAVFLPSPTELFGAGAFFSFGAKEAKALKTWSFFFARAFPSTPVFFCGKGLGGISAIFAAAKLSRASGKRCNLGGVIAESPCLSAAQSMKRVAGELFPRNILCIPVYAGVCLASIFCGLGVGGRNACRAAKRLLALKKKHSDIVVDYRAKS